MGKMLLPIVEGDGDVIAVPILLRRILYEHLHAFDWDVNRPKRAHSLAALKKRLSDYLRYARIENADAVLILLDLDDGCPVVEAQALSAEIGYAPFPVSIVLAHREYEAWFLASIEVIVSQGEYHFTQKFSQHPLPPLSPEGDAVVEEIRDAKGWLTSHMKRGYAYKETKHQPSMTKLIDIKLAAQRSRSFRHLLQVMERLVGKNGLGG